MSTPAALYFCTLRPCMSMCSAAKTLHQRHAPKLVDESRNTKRTSRDTVISVHANSGSDHRPSTKQAGQTRKVHSGEKTPSAFEPQKCGNSDRNHEDKTSFSSTSDDHNVILATDRSQTLRLVVPKTSDPNPVFISSAQSKEPLVLKSSVESSRENMKWHK